jgi:uncharacterized membrane protein
MLCRILDSVWQHGMLAGILYQINMNVKQALAQLRVEQCSAFNVQSKVCCQSTLMNTSSKERNQKENMVLPRADT